jgi:predicted nucleic acid-binding protein
MMRLFLDANILFTAAHNPSGKSALIIKLSADGHWRTLTCRLAVEEARRNIERKYPHCLPALDALISTIEVTPTGAGSICLIDLPSKDRPIFEAATANRATHFLTGDTRHFGAYMNKPEKNIHGDAVYSSTKSKNFGHFLTTSSPRAAARLTPARSRLT